LIQKALMAIYSLSIDPANQQYIHFNVQFDQLPANAKIYLPKWRPGRYELGNFAKNLKNFRVFTSDGKRVPFQKCDASSWQLENEEHAVIRIEYSYYANELNAGSTYVSKDQLYVNPVNCFIYAENEMEQTQVVNLAIPEQWSIAGSMKRDSQSLSASSYHELADSPFICSEQLQYNQYESNGTIFHMWFNGACKLHWKRLIHDFKQFTDKQMEKFIEFPVSEYHFIFQILPYKAYHGVEHQKSTVIALGPTYDLFDTLYTELLGVSSHELYHTWNVKAIRPIELFPYNYQAENFSKLGYLCEGVTTYMGDLMLFKSGLFSFNQYAKELTTQLQKHFDNFGRFNYSVADSSWDTWLDGYVPGAPGRKVSIYTEGCLLAFVTDIQIRKNTGNKLGLDEVMKRLYFNFALENKGVSEQDYQELVIELGGEGMKQIFADYFYGTRPFEAILTEALEYIGLELTHQPSRFYSQGNLGFKTVQVGLNHVVKAIYPGSPADLGGIMLEDEIIAVNGFVLNGELEKWLMYADDDAKTITVVRSGKLVETTLPEVQRHFYLEYGIAHIAENELSAAQKKAFEHWRK
jgi:predicted metalloprotease with PDZ domain